METNDKGKMIPDRGLLPVHLRGEVHRQVQHSTAEGRRP